METYIVCHLCGTIYHKDAKHECRRVQFPQSSINNYVLGAVSCLAILTMCGAALIIAHMLLG